MKNSALRSGKHQEMPSLHVNHNFINIWCRVPGDQQESIPVGCVPTACWPYLVVSPWTYLPSDITTSGRDLVPEIYPPPPRQNDWQTPVKHYLPPTSLAGGKNKIERNLVARVRCETLLPRSLSESDSLW